MVEIWIYLALGATLGWGLGQVAAKRGVGALGPRKMVAMVALGEAGVFLAAYLALGAPSLGGSRGLLLGLGAGLTGMLGFVAYYETIARGTISRVGTIIAAYPAVTVILALAFLGETITLTQGLGIALLLGSAVLLGRGEGQTARTGGRLLTVLVLLSFLLWGVWGFLAKVVVTEVGEGPTFFYFGVSNLLVGVPLLLFVGARATGPFLAKRRLLAWPTLTIMMGSGGVILMTLALVGGPASLVAALTGAYPVVTVLAATTLLHERFTRIDVLAVVAFVVGLLAVVLG
ncbi:MAG: DMT family transporter [Candidatus Thermoplasmatota archaeon]|nr:DMT family transporter [Candidatus Thermoplasmatota archaeon]